MCYPSWPSLLAHRYVAQPVGVHVTPSCHERILAGGEVATEGHDSEPAEAPVARPPRPPPGASQPHRLDHHGAFARKPAAGREEHGVATRSGVRAFPTSRPGEFGALRSARLRGPGRWEPGSRVLLPREFSAFSGGEGWSLRQLRPLSSDIATSTACPPCASCPSPTPCGHPRDDDLGGRWAAAGVRRPNFTAQLVMTRGAQLLEAEAPSFLSRHPGAPCAGWQRWWWHSRLRQIRLACGRRVPLCCQ